MIIFPVQLHRGYAHIPHACKHIFLNDKRKYLLHKVSTISLYLTINAAKITKFEIFQFCQNLYFLNKASSFAQFICL